MPCRAPASAKMATADSTRRIAGHPPSSWGLHVAARRRPVSPAGTGEAVAKSTPDASIWLFRRRLPAANRGAGLRGSSQKVAPIPFRGDEHAEDPSSSKSRHRAHASSGVHGSLGDRMISLLTKLHLRFWTRQPFPSGVNAGVPGSLSVPGRSLAKLSAGIEARLRHQATPSRTPENHHLRQVRSSHGSTGPQDSCRPVRRIFGSRSACSWRSRS